eukprot:2057241-Prymnesium_polylepis.1
MKSRRYSGYTASYVRAGWGALLGEEVLLLALEACALGLLEHVGDGLLAHSTILLRPIDDKRLGLHEVWLAALQDQ